MAVWHVEQIVARHGPVVTIPPGSMPARLMQQTYQEAATRCALDKHLLSGRLYQVLMELSRLEPATPTVTPSLSRATSFIEQEYAKPTLAVGDMSRQAGLSAFHFARLFRRQLGVSPNVYLTQVRVNHARNLLMSTQFSIKQVAQLVGFSDSSYFCKIYRRHHRHSPGSLRKK